MGPYLSVPKKEKATVSGEGKNIIYAASEMQGNNFFFNSNQFRMEKHNGRCTHYKARSNK